MDPHPTYIEGTVTLSDGSKTSFSIVADLGWQQWGNHEEKLRVTGVLMDALSLAAHEAGLADTDEE